MNRQIRQTDGPIDVCGSASVTSRHLCFVANQLTPHEIRSLIVGLARYDADARCDKMRKKCLKVYKKQKNPILGSKDTKKYFHTFNNVTIRISVR